MPIGLIGGLLAGAGAIGGALIGGNASQSAAQTQANAANNASNITAQEYLINQQALAPYLDIGTNAQSVLGQLYGITYNPSQNGSPLNGSYNIPVAQQLSAAGVNLPDPSNPQLISQFQQSPGYAYQLQQMMNAVQNSAAGKTGAISGNMLQALQSNAGGLANQDYWNFYNALTNNYNTQYNQALTQRNSVTSALGALGGQGQNAAVQQGGFGQNAAAQIGQNTNLAASATAAGTLGSANSLVTALNSLTGNSPLNSLTGNSSLANSLAVLLGGNYGSGDYGGGGDIY